MFAGTVVLVDADGRAAAVHARIDEAAESAPGLPIVLLSAAPATVARALLDRPEVAATVGRQSKPSEVADVLVAATSRRVLPALKVAPVKQSLLTTRELEIVRLASAGTTNDGIAQALQISTHTVRTHMQNLMMKLGVHSRFGAVAAAREAGLLPRHEDSRRA
jgi:DNA-binding NarL/FixJ family response regulator